MGVPEQPLAPLNTIAAVLNMDMIGRNEEIPVGGGGRFAGFDVQTAESNNNAVNLMGFSQRARRHGGGRPGERRRRCFQAGREEALRQQQLEPRPPQRPVAVPDARVPAVGFMTGLHPDYHTQYDRPEKINYVKMEKIARLVHQASWDIANADARPKAPAARTSTQ